MEEEGPEYQRELKTVQDSWKQMMILRRRWSRKLSVRVGSIKVKIVLGNQTAQNVGMFILMISALSRNSSHALYQPKDHA